jgi:hypothetical protein
MFRGLADRSAPDQAAAAKAALDVATRGRLSEHRSALATLVGSMRVSFACLVLLAGLGACASPAPVGAGRARSDPFVLAPPGPLVPVTQPEAPPRAPDARISRRWACVDGTRLSAVPIGHDVELAVAGRRRRLHRTAAPLGTRYAAGKWIFWVRGDEATLFRPAAPQVACSRAP